MSNLKPTPTGVIMAMWEYLGRLTVPQVPESGLHWGIYVKSGGLARYLGR